MLVWRSSWVRKHGRNRFGGRTRWARRNSGIRHRNRRVTGNHIPIWPGAMSITGGDGNHATSCTRRRDHATSHGKQLRYVAAPRHRPGYIFGLGRVNVSSQSGEVCRERGVRRPEGKRARLHCDPSELLIVRAAGKTEQQHSCRRQRTDSDRSAQIFAIHQDS